MGVTVGLGFSNAAALFTVLNLDADGRPVKTRRNLCAQGMPC